MSSEYVRVPTAEPAEVMDCTAPECGARDGMARTHDLTDHLDAKCGEVWACTECGAEFIDEW